MIIADTTRQPRPGEEDGKDYNFVNKADMEKAIANNEFIEHAQFSGNMYGTRYAWPFRVKIMDQMN